MGKRLTEETVARWREIVARQSASGMTVAQFCRAESISAPSFYAWRRQLGGAEAPAEASCGAPDAGSFLPVTVDLRGRSAPLRIFLPHGVCVELGAETCSLADAVRWACESARC